MAVKWNWKHKVGEVHYFDTRHKQHFKLNMYTGNMMCCFLYEFKEEDEATHETKDMYNFITWFNDVAHAKRCLKSDKDFFKNLLLGNPKFRKFRLRIHDAKDANDYSCKEMMRFAKLLVSYGYKVEVY